ncbi:MAG: bifunctional 2-keto-4-hydroxyglutarate aldolase/2-keto-3-deoxy-6-phosphogluconate aldolase [Selenomonadales bacterium]|nr:bifunctional 2-keto-4-hydroxyglutarate aldolase/2-keto-3-deoxy-6-phosphogluconate aldolase [Selenomonadales bacterium]
MKKHDVLGALVKSGLVAVVRAEDAATAEEIAAACLAGGLSAVEITFTVPGALEIIGSLRAQYKNELLLGAGTVLDSETARMAILAGARYVVSPHLNQETAKLCNRYQVPYLAGVMTVREAVEAMECGVDILKVFPGELYGPAIIKSFLGPLPHANFMPTGGVSLENVGEWIKSGAVAVGVGSQLTAPAKLGNYEAVTAYARNMLSAIKAARGS